MRRAGLGRGFWFRAKILEIVALTLIEPGEEFFCERQKRLALDRVERVKQALARDLENPPTLSQLGREAGCSPFYLSRIFSEYTGLTISRYLRNLRLERAAELLRSGRSNVTEAAIAVGYSSLSHFSKAFAEDVRRLPMCFSTESPNESVARVEADGRRVGSRRLAGPCVRIDIRVEYELSSGHSFGTNNALGGGSMIHPSESRVDSLSKQIEACLCRLLVCRSVL